MEVNMRDVVYKYRRLKNLQYEIKKLGVNGLHAFIIIRMDNE